MALTMGLGAAPVSAAPRHQPGGGGGGGSGGGGGQDVSTGPSITSVTPDKAVQNVKYVGASVNGSGFTPGSDTVGFGPAVAVSVSATPSSSLPAVVRRPDGAGQRPPATRRSPCPQVPIRTRRARAACGARRRPGELPRRSGRSRAAPTSPPATSTAMPATKWSPPPGPAPNRRSSCGRSTRRAVRPGRSRSSWRMTTGSTAASVSPLA